MEVFIQTLSMKHVDATAKKKYNKPKISGTFIGGSVKLGMTPGGGASAGVCARAWSGRAFRAARSGIVRRILQQDKRWSPQRRTILMELGCGRNANNTANNMVK
jgi:hypothetical protein